MQIKAEVLETELSPGPPGRRSSLSWPDWMMSSLRMQTVAGCRVLAVREQSFLGATCPGLFQKWKARPSGTCCQLPQPDQIADFILFF